MALVRNDTEEGGKMNDFEATTSYLLPHDPVSKKRAAGSKQGNMVEKRDRMQILLSEVQIDSAMAASAEISQLESKFINKRMEEVDQVYTVEQEDRPTWSHIPCEVDEVASVLCSVSPLLDPTTMCSLLSERGEIGRFQSSVGSTNATRSDYPMDELTVETVSGMDSDSSEASDNVQDDFFENVDDPLQVDLDLDEFMASAAHAKPRRNTTAEHLSKVW
jgi:hypothetical protein